MLAIRERFTHNLRAQKISMTQRFTLKNKSGQNGLGAGVWNIGPGADPFGGPTRVAIPILDRLPMLADAGMKSLDQQMHEEMVRELFIKNRIKSLLLLRNDMPHFYSWGRIMTGTHSQYLRNL